MVALRSKEIKMKKINAIALFLTVVLLLCACSKQPEGGEAPTNADGSPSEETTTISASTEFVKSEKEMFTSRDFEVGYDESTAVIITLKGDSIETSSDKVAISGSTATISEDGCYVISGTLDDGQIIVAVSDTAKPQLVLKNANISCSSSAPLYVRSANKVFVTLANGTQNSLSSGESFVAIDDNNINATLYAKDDLTLNGEGSLTLSSPAGHAISAKDDLAITSGSYTISAASHGIDANNSIRISNAQIKISTKKDGIHAEHTEDTTLGYIYISSGSFEIDAEGDGISASAEIQINGGSYDILSGGGAENAESHASSSQGGFMGGQMGRPGQSSSSSSTTTDTATVSVKGIKSTGSMMISDGSFKINSADDAFHSNLSVIVGGGSFEIATGDDAFHADEELSVSAGKINVSESYEGLEAQKVVIMGGEINVITNDDGINAAGGTDSSGTGGIMGGDAFGGRGPGGGASSSSTGSIVISGGTLYIQASGDGIDANGTFCMSGGFVTVCGPTQGDTATLDYDVSGTITGGTFIGTGASGMAQTFSASEQGVISVNCSNTAANTQITLSDAKGNVIVSYSPKLSFAIVIISTPEMTKGEKYTLTVGSATQEFEAT